MNLNDYTHHICDRFVLMFIAFIGLVGTSYILTSGNNPGNNTLHSIEEMGIGLQQSIESASYNTYLNIISEEKETSQKKASQNIPNDNSDQLLEEVTYVK